MKKIIPIIVILVIIAGAIALLTHKHDSKDTSTNNTKTSTSNNSPTGTSTQPEATNMVTIDNFNFSPSTITVKKGSTVTWTNHDSVAHTVQETDGKDGPMSSNVATNQSYSFTYNTVGTFAYHCSIHPDMTGTVTVTE